MFHKRKPLLPLGAKQPRPASTVPLSFPSTVSVLSTCCSHSYKVEVRRRFINTTVRDESQVTPQGSHCISYQSELFYNLYLFYRDVVEAAAIFNVKLPKPS